MSFSSPNSKTEESWQPTLRRHSKKDPIPLAKWDSCSSWRPESCSLWERRPTKPEWKQDRPRGMNTTLFSETQTWDSAWTASNCLRITELRMAVSRTDNSRTPRLTTCTDKKSSGLWKWSTTSSLKWNSNELLINWIYF